jgi:TM2 domain-containing membrane protein YozV
VFKGDQKMNCQYCNNPLPPNANNCPNCGAAAAPQPQFQQAPPPPQTVQQVVIQQAGPAAPALPPKSRLTYILLACFLGGLGIHNFYAGYTGRGIAQLLITLLTCWFGGSVVVGIWVLIEIFTVNTDANGTRMV